MEHDLAAPGPVRAGSKQLVTRNHKITEHPLSPDRGFATLLFDVDGTILSSTAAAERIWTDSARRRGLDVAAFLPTIHGVRLVDTVRRLGFRALIPKPKLMRSRKPK